MEIQIFLMGFGKSCAMCCGALRLMGNEEELRFADT